MTKQSSYDVLWQWSEIAKQLKELRDLESKLRKQVIEDFFGETAGIREGTEKHKLPEDWQLIARFSATYSLDKPGLVAAALTELEQSGEDGKFVAERLVSWKPQLSVAEYRKLSAAHDAIISKVLTIKEASTQLELKPPK